MALGRFKVQNNGPEVAFYIRQGEREFSIGDLPYQAAIEIGLALLEKGKLAEEHAKANQIIQDQAIMFRSGAPFALTRHPKILSAARVEAVHSRELRRSNLALVDTGIASQEQVPVPTVTHAPRSSSHE